MISLKPQPQATLQWDLGVLLNLCTCVDAIKFFSIEKHYLCTALVQIATCINTPLADGGSHLGIFYADETQYSQLSVLDSCIWPVDQVDECENINLHCDYIVFWFLVKSEAVFTVLLRIVQSNKWVLPKAFKCRGICCLGHRKMHFLLHFLGVRVKTFFIWCVTVLVNLQKRIWFVMEVKNCIYIIAYNWPAV